MTRIECTAEDAGRVDKALARRFPDAGRKALARLFADGAVKIAGKKAAKGDFVAAGDVIELATDPQSGDALRPVADDTVQLDVLLERADLVAVNKPAGMPSQPLRAGERGTAANGIAARWPECAALGDDVRDGGLVHRLDVGTSGVLVAARTAAAYRALRDGFGGGQIAKTYLAITHGKPVASECEVSLAQRGDHVVVDALNGLAAHTTFTVEKTGAEFCLVRCAAHTGRMHQVRAHLAQVGSPIVGDTRYGGRVIDGEGFFLHAATMTLPDGTQLTAPLPARFTAALVACGLAS
jgi:23S rRNA pseudouridine1911/1915/1917 synthase